MGQIVAAMATVHAPQLFTYPPSEDPAQLDAIIVIGADHLETFFLSAVPTFAIVGGEKSKAAFARKTYALPIHPFAEELLDQLVTAGFDKAYSQDAELGDAFDAV